MYVYKASEPFLWTVGFYDPSGKWQPESDHPSRDEAAARCNWLNGGRECDDLVRRIDDVEQRLDQPDWRQRR